MRPVMHGVGQEAASVPAAPCLAWHSIKQAVLGPVKISSWQGSRLCRDAAGVPGHSRGGGETRDPARQLGHNEENSYSCIPINVTTTMNIGPFVFFPQHFLFAYTPHLLFRNP